MNLSFARALLKLHLAALDTFGAAPDQIDCDIAEDGISAGLTAHVGDEGLAAGFDPEGFTLESYRHALKHRGPVISGTVACSTPTKLCAGLLVIPMLEKN